jgi:hypothetical protein
MKKILCFLCVLVSAFACYAQQIILTGTVTNKQDQAPIPGVSVQSKSATVATDLKGVFSIPTFIGDRVRFTHSGMLAKQLCKSDSLSDYQLTTVV